MLKRIPVLVIFAPTATGKTDFLLSLLKSQNIPKAKIISADSMQVYRGLDICTAKPLGEERDLHCLIDIKNPDEQFSVAEFVDRADSLCEELFSSGTMPIVAGGTGFYIRSFLLGLPPTPKSDNAVRARLKEEARRDGNGAMWQRLASLDPSSAAKINPNDLYRILRALEIIEISGESRTAFASPPTLRAKYEFKTLILERDRADLYKRIDARVEQMFALGLADEIAALAKKYKASDSGMKAIGCREFFEAGAFSDSPACPTPTNEIKSRIKRNSKKYAKKQYVFMRGIPDAKIFHLEAGEGFSAALMEEAASFLARGQST